MNNIPEYLWRDAYKAYIRAYELDDDSADLTVQEMKNFLIDEFDDDMTIDDLQDFIDQNPE
jgi:hypothetical protein